jgi:hypothetical protein
VILEYKFKKMPTCTCREIKNKLFLVLPLELAHELIDDHAFLIMGIVIVSRISSLMRVHCCGTRVLKRSSSVIYYKIVLSPESVFGSWALVISLFKKIKNIYF